MSTTKLILTWGSENIFELKCRVNDEDEVTVVRGDGCLKCIWPHVATICNKFFEERVKVATDAMI